MDTFSRAKEIGLRYVTEWIPDGRMEGREWVCLNPTRPDHNKGSFKINVDTGKWADFADDSGGNDCISLYAYLNRSEMERRVNGYSGNNYEGMIQFEAAKSICEKYDNSYFPGAYDEYIPKATGGDHWAGYRPALTGCAEYPDIQKRITSLGKYLKSKFVDKWAFHNKQGDLVGYVARFVNGSKKDDRPLTLWTNGRDYKWRVKGLEKWPLYNLPELERRQNDPILLVEGQKCAEVAKNVLTKFIVSGYYASVERTDFTPLIGRTVYYWFDPDTTGRKKMTEIKALCAEYEAIFYAVHSPDGKPKGWDIADAIEEGWEEKTLNEHILNTERGVINPEKFIDDESFPFKIIGMTNTDVYFYPEETCSVYSIKRNGLNRGSLINIMSQAEWWNYFKKDTGKGVDWEAAADSILRMAAKKPIFDSTLIRGSGAWIDKGRVIINTGTRLLQDKVESGLFRENLDFVYEKMKERPYEYGAALSTEDASRMIDILSRLRFKDRVHHLLLAGWVLLAPFCGAITWRPHIWVTGPKGSGKTWILENIVYKILDRFSIRAQGASTAAGIRQSLKNSTLPMIMDEAESDIMKQRDKMEEILTMTRQASSGNEYGASILHGSESMHGREWIVRSMFMFSSIGASIKHEADRSRFSVLQLGNPKVMDQELSEKLFKDLEESVKIFTPSWGVAFNARTLNIIDEVLKAITIFRSQASIKLGNRRAGDQLGTLLAGAYMVTHDKSPIASEVSDWLDQLKIGQYDDGVEVKDDAELCLDEILSHRIELSTMNGLRKKANIAALMHYYFFQTIHRGDQNYLDSHFEADTIKKELEQYGIKLIAQKDGAGKIQIAKGHVEMRRILKDTAWSNTYSDFLGRLSFCNDSELGPGTFAGIRKRFRELDAIEVLDQVPF